MGIEMALMAAAAAAYGSTAPGSANAKPEPQNTGGTYSDPVLAKRRQATTGKCPCCGSRSFRVHASLRICAYCRVAVDGQVVGAASDGGSRLGSLGAQSDYLSLLNSQANAQGSAYRNGLQNSLNASGGAYTGNPWSSFYR